MSIQKVNITDKIKDFAGKYNDTTDEIVISGLVNASNQLELTKNGGGIITIDLPFSNDKIVTGMELTVTGAGPFTGTITAGSYQIDGVVYVYAGGVFPIAVVTSPNERIDIFYADNLGVVTYLAGTPSLTPVKPTNPAGTLLIGVVYVNSTGAGGGGSSNINAGILNNQTARWDSASNTWLPNSNLLASNTKVAIGTALTNATLAVDGDIEILPMIAPFPVTDKLYNLSGDLYWNGSLVGLADGITTGSHLYWNGTSWLENDILLRLPSGGGYSVDDINYNTTDATGVNVLLNIGTVSGAERGIELDVVDTLNGYNAVLSLMNNGGLGTLFSVQNQDSNNFTTSRINSVTSQNTFSVVDSTNDDSTVITQGLNAVTTIESSREIFDPTNYSSLSVSAANPVKPRTTILSTNGGNTNSLGVASDTINLSGLNTNYDLRFIQDIAQGNTSASLTNLLNTDVIDFTLDLLNKTNTLSVTDGTDISSFIQEPTNNTITTNGYSRIESDNSTELSRLDLYSNLTFLYNRNNPLTKNAEINLNYLSGALLKYEDSVTPTNNVSINLFAGKTNINSGLRLKQRNTAISLTVVNDDYVIIVTAVPRTITLPLAPVDGETYIVKSNGVATGGNPITVSGNGKNIDSAATTTITTANGSVRVIFNNTLNKWFTI